MVGHNQSERPVFGPPLRIVVCCTGNCRTFWILWSALSWVSGACERLTIDWGIRNWFFCPCQGGDWSSIKHKATMMDYNDVESVLYV